MTGARRRLWPVSQGFVAFWASALVVLGLLLVAMGLLAAVLALILDMPWGSITGQAVLERTLAAIVLVVSGVLAGGPFIALGVMMRLSLEQRRLLVGISRRLRYEPPGPERRVI
jgi:hypothetical protein